MDLEEQVSLLFRHVPRLDTEYEGGQFKAEGWLTDEGIIEGCEYTGDAEDKFAC